MNETLVRALSGAVYVALLLFCTLFDNLTYHILFTTFFGLAVIEFSKLANFKYAIIFLIFGVLFSVALYLKPVSPYNFIYLTVGSCLFNILLLFNLFKDKPLFKTHKTFSHLFLYITIPFILILVFPQFSKNASKTFIIGMFVIIWSNDTFAYLAGKNFGKHKLMESISPKKTVEGFFGGAFAAILASLILSYFFTYFSVTLWIVTGLLLTIFGTLGDLIESKFKREAGVKDSGNIMPGHGGVLDRLDSIIFSVPFIFLFYLIYFYYV